VKTKLTERQIVTKSDPRFEQLDDLCFRAKNLYNKSLYLTRHSLFNENFQFASNFESILRDDTEYRDYRNMLDMASAQQVLRQVSSTWKAYFAAHKNWKQNPDKYPGEPKIPKYLKKDGRYPFTITTGPNGRDYSAYLLPDGSFKLPKKFNGLKIYTACFHKEGFQRVNEIKIISKKYQIEIFIAYTVEVPDTKPDNSRYLSIDLGLDNLAACVTNDQSLHPFVINGKSLKSINQYYNKKQSELRSEAKIRHNLDWTHRLDRLTEKRRRKIEDYLHCASKYLIEYCVQNDINTIIIGKNDSWKGSINLGSRTNQNFVYIPHTRFIDMVKYKGQVNGIDTICTEESYTSGTSFLDGEEPNKDYYNKSRRVHRGLFKSNEGLLINADINGAYQIMKKVVPNAFEQWDRGHVVSPLRISFS
jgi:putative transposase